MRKDVNTQGTGGGSVTVALPELRRDLIAMRGKHGADSAIGHRCSNLIGQLQAYQTAVAPALRRDLRSLIKRSMAELDELAR